VWRSAFDSLKIPGSDLHHSAGHELLGGDPI